MRKKESKIVRQVMVDGDAQLLGSSRSLRMCSFSTFRAKKNYELLFTRSEQHKLVLHFAHCSIHLTDYRRKVAELNRLVRFALRVLAADEWKRYFSPNWHHIERSSGLAAKYPTPIDPHHLLAAMRPMNPESHHSMRLGYIGLVMIVDRE